VRVIAAATSGAVQAMSKRPAVARPSREKAFRSAGSTSSCSSRSAIASTSRGATTKALRPSIANSGTAPTSVVTTGQPQAIASSGGRPNPSQRLGYSSTADVE